MNSPVTQIKERLSIEDVVSSYIKLERAGANLKAKCPFHNEKTPSFFVSPDRGSYYCFGCGASGDIFTFVEEFEGLDFKGTLKLLADRAGVPLQSYTKEDKENKSEKERLLEAMEESTKFFENNLASHKEAEEYLKSRGLNEKTIKDFRVGFVENDWRLLYSHLKGKKFTDLEIEKAGLAKKTDKGYYDRFRGRVMFPISDSSGRVIAFSGRIFVDDGKSAKYLNSPETPIFNKSSVLYGLDKAKESIRKNNFSILVEGQMDLILSHQAGYRNTIASSGTALSDVTISKENVVSNLGVVRRLSNNIVLAYDGDKAGFKASLRSGRIALSLGMDVKVANLPEGVDPADLIHKGGPEKWKEVIRDSKHIIEFLLGKILKEFGKDPRKIGREIKEKLLPYVASMESSIEKMHFIKNISDATGIKEQALNEDLKKITDDLKGEEREIREAVAEKEKLDRRDYIERRLLGIGLWKEDQQILEKLKEALLKYNDIKNDLIFEAEVFYQDSGNLAKDVSEMLSLWEEEKINEELYQKMQELNRALDSTQEAKLVEEINNLNKKKEDIKNGRLSKK